MTSTSGLYRLLETGMLTLHCSCCVAGMLVRLDQGPSPCVACAVPIFDHQAAPICTNDECGITLCVDCTPVRLTRLFLSVFPEAIGAGNSWTVGKVWHFFRDVAAMSESELTGALQLVPAIPDVRCLCGENYSTEGYVPACKSTVYFTTHSSQAVVYDLLCINSMPGCTRKYIGHEDSLHRQTSDSIFHYEIFYMFNNLIKRMHTT